jgi:hypothetical protein
VDTPVARGEAMPTPVPAVVNRNAPSPAALDQPENLGDLRKEVEREGGEKDDRPANRQVRVKG